MLKHHSYNHHPSPAIVLSISSNQLSKPLISHVFSTCLDSDTNFGSTMLRLTNPRGE